MPIVPYPLSILHCPLSIEFMQQALALAGQAEQLGEVPVGALVVRDGQVLGSAHNRCVADNDPSAHAELLAIREAAAAVGNYRLTGACLYSTLEPCVMCAGAILNARLETLVFATEDERFGACGSQLNLLDTPWLSHRCRVERGVMRAESRALLQGFFERRR